MNKRLGVINDWFDRKSAVFWNKDGSLKALDVLRKVYEWEVVFFKKHEKTFTWEHDYVDLHFSPDPKKALLEWGADAALFFCDFSRPILGEFADVKLPKAICYSGGRWTTYSYVPDIIFVESKSYVSWMKSLGLNVVQAFGTNTELFKPYKQPKVFDAFFPATFAGWKRHEMFAEALGSKGLVAGWWQPHEPMCVEVCFKYGCSVLHHQLAESVALMYNMAHTCVVTSSDVGGSQRTILEAMACNVPVIAMADSTMTSEYVRESGFGSIVEPGIGEIRAAVDSWKGKECNSRGWIMDNYSEFVYAKKVNEGILSIL